MLKPLQDKEYDQSAGAPPLVDSSKEKLDVGRIAVIASYHTKSEFPPNQVAMSILMEMQQPGVLIQQYGNTLFIAHASPEQGKYLFRALNADVVENYLRSSAQFIRYMKQQGATTLATQFNDPKILKLIMKVAKGMSGQPEAPKDFQAYRRPNEFLVVIEL